MSIDVQKLTQSRLKQIFDYDPYTGEFTTLIRRQRIGVGVIAGSVHSNGYVYIRVDCKRYSSHHLAFLYVNGYFPKKVLDHINQNKSDNRWSNLRECTQTYNQANAPAMSNNKSGYKGVCWHSRDRKYRSTIGFNNKCIYLGSFDCKHEAARVYNEAALKYFGEFAYLNEIK